MSSFVLYKEKTLHVSWAALSHKNDNKGFIRSQFKETNMDYQDMIRRVRRLDFIRNEQTADAAVKTILGILASRLSEEDARKISERFPASFKLVTDEQRNTSGPIPLADHITQIRAQFKLSVHQARVLVRNVLYYAKEAAGSGLFTEIGKSLPEDWAKAIQNA